MLDSPRSFASAKEPQFSRAPSSIQQLQAAGFGDVFGDPSKLEAPEQRTEVS